MRLGRKSRGVHAVPCTHTRYGGALPDLRFACAMIMDDVSCVPTFGTCRHGCCSCWTHMDVVPAGHTWMLFLLGTHGCCSCWTHMDVVPAGHTWMLFLLDTHGCCSCWTHMDVVPAGHTPTPTPTVQQCAKEPPRGGRALSCQYRRWFVSRLGAGWWIWWVVPHVGMNALHLCVPVWCAWS
jgi:hypothetical protein